MRYLVAVGSVALLAGCATLAEGTSQAIYIETPDHAGAQCVLTSEEIGTRTVQTPATIELPKSKHDIAVSCKQGCYTGAGIIGSHFESATAGNILAGGVLGVGVDAATGAMNKYDARTQIVLSKSASCG